MDEQLLCSHEGHCWEGINSLLQSDIYAADLRWSLFIAALSSYRHDSLLRPFPPAFIKHDMQEKDAKKLLQVACEVPPLRELASVGRAANLTSTAWSLVHWVLSCGNFQLHSCDREMVERIQVLSKSEGSIPTPSGIFRVECSRQWEHHFRDSRQKHSSFYAFHGSRVENFYSILHNGFIQHLNKNSFYGTGTYLSSEPSVSLHYSPTGHGWTHSIFGKHISCLAVCEVLDHPDVKCCDHGSSRAYSTDSMGGKVPDGYFLVQNNEVIQVRYLLVYSSNITGTVFHRRWFGIPSWVKDYKFIILMACYILVLVAIGISNSRRPLKFWNKLVAYFIQAD